MRFEGKTVVVTGGASGIGAALVARFRLLGANVFIFDLYAPDGVDFIDCDVADEDALRKAIHTVEVKFGSIDVFVSNAGVMSRQPGNAASASCQDWERCWSVNVMSHVFAARALLPSMIARGSGYFVTVASAAGLLNQIGDAAYSATKHAAVSFAESLAITHGSDGIGVSVACPQYVATPLIGLTDGDAEQFPTLMSADQVAAAILQAVRENRFLVLPHPEVSDFVQSRAADHDRWVRGMARLRQRSIARFGDARPDRFYKLL